MSECFDFSFSSTEKHAKKVSRYFELICVIDPAIISIEDKYTLKCTIAIDKLFTLVWITSINPSTYNTWSLKTEIYY
jgi:hypothetical protein